ncbi:MAG: hypothetical protein K2M65_05345, partial [Muribaculaceae bacterium]|nr:hypothetical protein [Muribaculaceae bacterium]
RVGAFQRSDRMMQRIILRPSNRKHPIYSGLCASGACGRTVGDAPTIMFPYISQLIVEYAPTNPNFGTHA